VTRVRPGAVALFLVLVAGCAERGVTSGPPAGTGAGTWAAVALASTLAAVVLAALYLLPARRGGGATFAAAVLALQAGAATVGGAVIIGAALRSGQLVDRPADAEQAASLVRLTGLDGRDVGFFRLAAGLTFVLGALLVVILVLAARFAADRDPLERVLASGVLAIEVVASLAAAVVVVVIGDDGLPFLLPALAFPVLVIALVTCWPRPAPRIP